ncbi:hypothetical protein [Mucilaginibacter polytrichastri]|uniref:Uncharacterized protein n=1 Tax=Mucilaginibacter polytrichastri TaxID=1302689 RepID=A0A1Q5ZVY7_9SPHI|nr:hypothetical protein [Mucilaginibacter polytrichastri]OKS85931.1 hypothetical protein RG47T_1378 [Mucilaginibacter polytrichastri]SFS60449.1 hypothetical protein SAMN04487890_102203 [Mucilaginibacter polytrichastri]
MDKKKLISKEVSNLQQLNERQTQIDEKLDELITLLGESNLDSESVKHIQSRFNKALDISDINKNQIHEFKKIDELSATSSREELLDEFSVLLTNNRIDNHTARKFIRQQRASGFVLIMIAVVMIILGFAMIIMPAPPYFEMFTIYYFNPNDGVTIMDVISLLIILAGVYLLIKTVYQKNIARSRS